MPGDPPDVFPYWREWGVHHRERWRHVDRVSPGNGKGEPRERSLERLGSARHLRLECRLRYVLANERTPERAFRMPDARQPEITARAWVIEKKRCSLRHSSRIRP